MTTEQSRADFALEMRMLRRTHTVCAEMGLDLCKGQDGSGTTDQDVYELIAHIMSISKTHPPHKAPRRLLSTFCAYTDIAIVRFVGDLGQITSHLEEKGQDISSICVKYLYYDPAASDCSYLSSSDHLIVTHTGAHASSLQDKCREKERYVYAVTMQTPKAMTKTPP